VQYDKALLREKPKVPFSAGENCFSPYSSTRYVPCEGDFLEKGNNLVILNRAPTSDWLNVINVETAKEGWVYKSHVNIYYTQSPKVSAPAIAETYSGSSNSYPEITITNDSNRVFRLRLGESTYTIDPYESRKLTLYPGSYKYYGSSPGVLPAMGEKYFSLGHVYTWRFYIGSAYR
jgi:hypothetical protein